MNAFRRIGPYELRALIGAGGMGEVYLARDTKLGRDVAIKMLPPGVSHDPDRIRRFEREARTLAALNHPYIAHVYGVEEAQGGGALVMEFVEGPTLADRIARGPLPLDEALPIARQMAEALEYAHERGIVHRDLKPANVKLRPDGSVKVLDFGLAKALAPEALPTESRRSFDSPTGMAIGIDAPPQISDVAGVDADTTRLGTVLGTTSYMPPEQASGRQVDRRADIWSFGCVLYEMLTGRKAFQGATSTAAAADAPVPSSDISAIPATTPASLRLLLRRCLERDPRRRLRDIGEARVALEDLLSGRDPAAAAAEGLPARGRWARVLPWGVAALALAAAIGAMAVARESARPSPALRADLVPPADLQYRLIGDLAAPPVLTPDGLSLVHGATGAGRARLYVRSLETGETRPLERTEGATFPFVSPDGRAIGFFADGKLKKIDVGGTGLLTVCDAPNGRGGAWAPDGTIVFSPDFRAGLVKVRASGGTPEPLTTIDTTRHSTHRWPAITPDGRHVVYVAATHVFQPGDVSELRIVGLDGQDDRRLTSSPGSAIAVGTTLLFPQETTLVAQQLDADAGRLVGEPRTIASGVLTDTSTWRSAFTASADRLVFAPASLGDESHLTRVDRAGRTLGEVASGAPYRGIRMSPDGRSLVATRGAPGDLWTFDLERGTGSRFTVDPANEEGAIWSKDGQWIYYVTTRSDDRKDRFFRKPASGTGDAQLLYETSDRRDIEPTDISADGGRMLVRVGTSPFISDSAVYELALDGTRALTPVQAGPYVVRDATYSPDGRWIAYTSFESGTPQVYVVAAPDSAARAGGSKWQVSIDSGHSALWSSDGREIFFVDNASMLRASSIAQDASGGLMFGPPVPLFGRNFTDDGRSVAAAPDARSFVVNHRGDTRAQPLRVIKPWE